MTAGKMVMVLGAVIAVVAGSVYAEETADEARKKVNALRMQIERTEFDYEQNAQKAKEASRKKLDALKEEFRRSRAACLGEMKEMLEAMKDAQKEKIGGMRAEEKRLVEIASPTQNANFAKKKRGAS